MRGPIAIQPKSRRDKTKNVTIFLCNNTSIFENACEKIFFFIIARYYLRVFTCTRNISFGVSKIIISVNTQALHLQLSQVRFTRSQQTSNSSRKLQKDKRVSYYLTYVPIVSYISFCWFNASQVISYIIMLQVSGSKIKKN